MIFWTTCRNSSDRMSTSSSNCSYNVFVLVFWQIFILFWFVQLHWMLFQTIELLLKSSSKFLSVVEALWGICLGHLCQIFILDFWTTCRNSSDKMFISQHECPHDFLDNLSELFRQNVDFLKITALTMFFGNLLELFRRNVYFLKVTALMIFWTKCRNSSDKMSILSR
jgi:hypothetical protein